MANHIALRRIEADADSEPHQPDTIHATNRSNTMQAARVIKTIFFILVPIQVSLPSHSASERVTKSKGRPGGDLAQPCRRGGLAGGTVARCGTRSRRAGEG